MYNVVLVSQKIVDDTRCFFNAVGVCAYCILASVIFSQIIFSSSSAHSTGEFFLCVIRRTRDSIAGGLNNMHEAHAYSVMR